MKMIAKSMMEFRLAGETEVLGENLPQRHFCPSKNPTCPPGFEPGPPWWEAGDLYLYLTNKISLEHSPKILIITSSCRLNAV
jgi:hypothetical protein